MPVVLEGLLPSAQSTKRGLLKKAQLHGSDFGAKAEKVTLDSLGIVHVHVLKALACKNIAQ